MDKSLYVRLRHRIQARPNQMIKIEDVAQLVADTETLDKVRNISIHQINMSDKSIVVLDVMRIIKEIRKVDSELDIQTFGPAQTIVEVVYKKKRFRPMFFIGVWLLLFLGAALAIMNFHEDVSMRIVHQKIFKTITGLEDDKPLLLQIPYSIGLGLGMILFFNHVFRKRINEEPSPLEVEMFNYQQDLDQYVIMHENKESSKKIDDD
ncbi:stage V sporulation protein AA [Sutcliffiella horikoshii]|uniref:Stage V sporulation protein AA n=1 Tax=Sutcliffiella horikoshii TaxID=79883 RepID=A0A5D4TJ50_9BACI|nr:stage V sporulation protein AA [Sutcliffiella horikoshii]TYS74492.1 stage V sporulation protein AA [Sutcliffiella horikoshii]